MDDERDLNPESENDEIHYENNLRPTTLREYIGQEKVKANL